MSQQSKQYLTEMKNGQEMKGRVKQEIRRSSHNDVIKRKKKSNKGAMRKLREAVKNDPTRYEEAKRKERERYHARKAAGKIKTIDELSKREQRIKRRTWRESSKKNYYAKKERKNLEKFLDEQTPPSTPRQSPIPVHRQIPLNQPRQSPVPQHSGSSRVLSGRKIRRKNTDKLQRRILFLEMQLKKANRRKERYKKRAQRLLKEKKDTDTPIKKAQEVLKHLDVPNEVKKRFLFGDVISTQIEHNFKTKKKSSSEKRGFIQLLTGHKVKKYGYLQYLAKITSQNCIFGRRSQRQLYRRKMCDIKKQVTQFLEEDENSRLCPGKKDTITYKKVKKQKRFLNASLKSLYQKFKSTYPNIKISYTTFCSMRPFWVLQPAISSRNTCLCSMHANIALIITKLKFLKIIEESTPDRLVQSICCSDEKNKEKCLERACMKCKDKEVTFSEYDGDEMTFYEKWYTKREDVVIKQKIKKCQKTVKERIVCKKEEIVAALKESIPKFLLHLRNIYHQYAAIKTLKQGLKATEVLVHLDFSENYMCKYSEEVQSCHFGGSKKQVSLHTVVVYYKDEEKTKTLSVCTLSENMRHDPAAICAHLDPVFSLIRVVAPNLRTVHFLSDGATGQYKNRKMFFLMGSYLVKKYNLSELRWHYNESGHGKGAPDGIGGYVKRQADRLVALGKDISSCTSLYEELKTSTPNVNIMTMNNDIIQEVDDLLSSELSTFKGTLNIHEICWSQKNPASMQARKLTCLTCAPWENCLHYGLGQINLTTQQTELNGNHGIEDQQQLDYEVPEYSRSHEEPKSASCAVDKITTASHQDGYRPQRTVMFGGYYGHPMGRNDYIPEGAMTAFAAGDTIATNSFVGDEPDFEEKQEVTTLRTYRPFENEEGQEEKHPSLDESTTATKVSKRIPKKKPQKPAEDEDEDEDGNSNWPFGIGRNGVPSYNAFFPIMIGGFPGTRTRSNDGESGYYPGSATAIANSFSTGRGGVATSHATSFGDPSLAEFFRNRKNNGKKSYEE